MDLPSFLLHRHQEGESVLHGTLHDEGEVDLSLLPLGVVAEEVLLGENAVLLDCPLDNLPAWGEGAGHVTCWELGVTVPAGPTVVAWERGMAHVAYDGADFELSLDQQSSSPPVLEGERRPTVGCEVAAAWPPAGCAE